MATFGKAYYSFKNYNCAEAIEVLESLVRDQFESSRILELVAKCYFEMADYKLAEEWFIKAR